MPSIFDWKLFRKKVTDRPLIAGIVNVTPDSFSDGGRFCRPVDAVRHALALLTEGADFLDVGAESTRPGAGEVPAAEEWRRLEPVLTGILRERPDAVLSVDTRHAETADRAIGCGVQIINDVSGGDFDEKMLPLLGKTRAGAILMHTSAVPEKMQRDGLIPDDAVVETVRNGLHCIRERAKANGIAHDSLMLDVGIGFGKSRTGSYRLLAEAEKFEKEFALPFFWGVSRKSLLKSEPDTLEKRIAGSLALALRLAAVPVAALRVHDVALTLAALHAAAELRRAEFRVKE